VSNDTHKPADDPAAGAAFPVSSRSIWRGAILLALLTIALVMLSRSDAFHAALTQLLASSESIINAYPVLGPLLFIVLAAVSAMLAFASVAVLLPLAVAAWGEPLSILLLWIGWLLGGACTYLLGRCFGRKLAGWFGADSLLQRLEQHLGRDTPFVVVLLFQLALPSEVPGYLLGLVRYSAAKYLLALGLVELLYTIASVQLGASFIERQAGTVMGIGIAVALFSVAAFYLLRRRLRSRTT
jgi:uncharacterized membrane protein YdjX (TVP38/TMEM64 family)